MTCALLLPVSGMLETNSYFSDNFSHFVLAIPRAVLLQVSTATKRCPFMAPPSMSGTWNYLFGFVFFFLIAVQTYYLFPSHFGELSVLRLIQYQWSSWRNWVLQAESIQSTPVFHCIFKTLIKKLLKKTPRISEELYIFKQHCFADLTRTLPDIRTWLGETNYLLLWSLSE